MPNLTGGRALVTGGGKRLGAAIAEALGVAGMDVVVSYQASAVGVESTCARIREAGRTAHAERADLSDRAAARALVDAAQARLGGLDLLVLNAGIYEPGGLETTEDAAWDRSLALNVASAFALVQRAAPLLRASRGSVVALTCGTGVAPHAGYLAYQASKAALRQLVRALAIELAPDVRVNAVAPGSVLPPEDFDAATLAQLTRRIPLGRLGAARDVVDAVLYLARSDWSTGTEILVDGGRGVG
jgi:pteridine reductase